MPENLLNATLNDIIDICREKDIKHKKCHEPGDAKKVDYQKILSKYPIKKPIGGIMIKKINEKDLNDFRKDLKTHYSDSVIKSVYNLIKKAFSYAFDKEIIDTNIILEDDYIYPPESLKKTKVVEALSDEERNTFFNILKNVTIRKNAHDYRPQIYIADGTGMRMGEINALTINDVDLKKRTININKTISRGKNHKVYLKNGTKTKKGNRVIPITEQVYPYLKAAVDNYIPNKDKLIFYNHKHNSYISTQQVNDWVRVKCEKEGFNLGGVHRLRHTYASNCANNGMKLEMLARILGHSDITVTNKYYISIKVDDMKLAIETAYNNMNKTDAK